MADEAAGAWLAGLGDIKDLYERGYFSEDTLTAGDTETTALFGEGGAAFLLDGSWKAGYFTEHYPERLEELTVCCVPAKGTRQGLSLVLGNQGDETGYRHHRGYLYRVFHHPAGLERPGEAGSGGVLCFPADFR